MELLGLALAETSHDVLQLKNGMPVPIYKNKDTWRMSASSIVSDFTSSAANFAIDKAVSVAKDSANTLIDESANYLQEILDKTDQELTELTEEQIGTLEESLNRALSAIVDDAVGGVVIMVTEECSKAVERANAMGEDTINMIFDEFAGSVGSDISGLNAGNPATSIYSFKYSDYLKLFVLIGLYTNSDTVMRRVADVIQVNIDQKSDHTAENFKMSEAYTYARISVDVEVKPILITIPLIADTIKDEETDTRWYKFNYSEIAGY